MLASYIEEFPDIRKYWEQPAYHVLYLLHIGTVLVCDSNPGPSPSPTPHPDP